MIKTIEIRSADMKAPQLPKIRGCFDIVVDDEIWGRFVPDHRGRYGIAYYAWQKHGMYVAEWRGVDHNSSFTVESNWRLMRNPDREVRLTAGQPIKQRLAAAAELLVSCDKLVPPQRKLNEIKAVAEIHRQKEKQAQAKADRAQRDVFRKELCSRLVWLPDNRIKEIEDLMVWAAAKAL